MIFFLIVGSAVFLASANLLVAGVLEKVDADFRILVGEAIAGMTGGVAIALFGRAFPRRAPFVCPKCGRGQGYALESRQVQAWEQKYFPR